MYLCPKLSQSFWLCPAQSGEKHKGGIEKDGGSSLSSHSYIITNSKESLDGVYRVSDSQTFKEPQMLFLIGTQCSSSLGVKCLLGLLLLSDPVDYLDDMSSNFDAGSGTWLAFFNKNHVLCQTCNPNVFGENVYTLSFCHYWNLHVNSGIATNSNHINTLLGAKNYPTYIHICFLYVLRKKYLVILYNKLYIYIQIYLYKMQKSWKCMGIHWSKSVGNHEDTFEIYLLCFSASHNVCKSNELIK